MAVFLILKTKFKPYRRFLILAYSMVLLLHPPVLTSDWTSTIYEHVTNSLSKCDPSNLVCQNNPSRDPHRYDLVNNPFQNDSPNSSFQNVQKNPHNGNNSSNAMLHHDATIPNIQVNPLGNDPLYQKCAAKPPSLTVLSLFQTKNESCLASFQNASKKFKHQKNSSFSSFVNNPERSPSKNDLNLSAIHQPTTSSQSDTEVSLFSILQRIITYLFCLLWPSVLSCVILFCGIGKKEGLEDIGRIYNIFLLNIGYFALVFMIYCLSLPAWALGFILIWSFSPTIWTSYAGQGTEFWRTLHFFMIFKYFQLLPAMPLQFIIIALWSNVSSEMLILNMNEKTCFPWFLIFSTAGSYFAAGFWNYFNELNLVTISLLLFIIGVWWVCIVKWFVSKELKSCLFRSTFAFTTIPGIFSAIFHSLESRDLFLKSGQTFCNASFGLLFVLVFPFLRLCIKFDQRYDEISKPKPTKDYMCYKD